ncbi:MAG: peptidylprolyl isomerase [Dehalococcoidia bacterium]
MSKRGSRRRRRRGGQAGAEGSAKAKLPFPYSVLANVKLFYLVGIAAMIIGLVAGVLVTFGGSSPHSTNSTTSPSDSEDDDTVVTTPDFESEQPPEFQTYGGPPELTIDLSKRYFATIETEKGTIRVELFAEKAPETVNNFVFLARDGFYDGLAFHFVLKGFIAMAGDPACTVGSTGCAGLDGPGYTLPLEEKENGLSHGQGALAMVSDGGASHGSQFYITYDDLSQQLDGTDVVFGQVVEGIEVLQVLSETNPSLPLSPPTDRIVGITVDEEPAG